MKKLLPILLIACLLMSACSAVVSAPADETAPSASCTVGISCGTLTENMHLLVEEKHALVPEDGWILPPTSMSADGSAAFELLLDAVREQKIHMEHENAYIKGIANLYEFDAGEYSGWGYLVNGEYPTVPSDEYIPSDGDEIVFVYMTEADFYE